ncbi:DUF4412 domain-containing protein [Pedobacter sp. Du54]|uniref:DUF4412 domain-containing protein n=1 Tax=Pedobacter anseongensis TaxID=3133439 RepID=UPI0030B09027
MMRIKALLISLFFVCTLAKNSTAEDRYAYYSTKDQSGRAIDIKMYAKNGDARMELITDMAGMNITITSLVLKKNPDEIITLNSFSKSYSKRVKPKMKPTTKSYTITIVGKEKVGIYNCTRVRIKSDDKSFDTWYTKDLPTLHLPIETNQANLDKKLIDELERKGISGMMVKTVYFNPGTTTPKLTMQLMKYETKPLSASLFTVPADYKETKGNPYTNISPEKKKEMMKQMMEQLKKKQH